MQIQYIIAIIFHMHKFDIFLSENNWRFLHLIAL